MILMNNISLNHSIKHGLKYLNSKGNFEKGMIFFWFLGPIIFLIERSPADIWLTLISIIFLFKSFVSSDWSWVKIKWFKFAFIFWVCSLISALFGPMPIFTFGEGFSWIRFPLYAVAIQHWIGRNRNIRVIMLFILITCMMIMSIILFSEVIIEPKTNLTWPYGDLIPGSYLAKFCLPAHCVLVSIAVIKLSKKSIFGGMYLIVTLIASFLTGERNNFLLRLCSAFLAIFSFKFNIKMIITWFLVLLSIIYVAYNFNSESHHLFTNISQKFVNSIPIINFDNTYWGTWRSGIQQWFETPVLGVGPSGTRHTCGYLTTESWLPGENYCGNHPHNTYIQILSETGILGAIFFLLMLYYIFQTCFKARKLNKNCIMSCTAFIIPLSFFFPLQHAGSFFGQWNNLFMWFAIGFAISQINSKEKN